MRPTVVVGVAALTFATVLAGTVATAEGVEAPTYRSLQEARFRPVTLPTDTGSGVPLTLDDVRFDGPLARTSSMARLLPDAFAPGSLVASGTVHEATSDRMPGPTPATAGAVEGVVMSGWQRDAETSWYGPGFYGHRTACGYALTETLIGVAHRTLPCGTRVAFRYAGRVVVAPVVDRGPYVAGREWDLTAGLAIALGHLFTGPLDWRLE